MASEITATSRLTVTKGSYSFTGPSRSKRIDMAGTVGATVPFTATTTPTALTIPAPIGTVGVCEISNIDSSYTIYVDGDAGSNFANTIVVKPGETWQVRLGLAANSIYVKSSSGTPEGLITILED